MGLEPTTPGLQSRCSSKLSYVPVTSILRVVPDGKLGEARPRSSVDSLGATDLDHKTGRATEYERIAVPIEDSRQSLCSDEQRHVSFGRVVQERCSSGDVGPVDQITLLDAHHSHRGGARKEFHS